MSRSTLYDRHMLSTALTVALIITLLTGCDQVMAKRSCQDFFSATDLTGYQLIDGGMALHIESATVWYRCPAGQRFRDNQCHGEAVLLNFTDAAVYAAEFSEQSTYRWQMPTNEQFRAITSQQCLNPAVNTTVFPQLPIENYWTHDRSGALSNRRCVAYSYQGRIACREPDTALHRFMLVATP